MEWTEIAILAGVFGIAAFILYRAYWKKKFCPAVYGSSDNKEPEKKTTASKEE